MNDNRSNKASADIGAEAFEEFKRIAKQEQADGAQTLAYERLVPTFSTAPKDYTNNLSVVMRYWSRNGDTEALLKFGTELRNWAQDNGYHAV